MFDVYVGYGARASELATWEDLSRKSGWTRSTLAEIFYNHYRKMRDDEAAGCAQQDPTDVLVMGTTERLTAEKWRARATQLKREGEPPPPFECPAPYVNRTGGIRVSAIASLYKGGRYIEKFLESMMNQTLGDAFELIIVDANSPENEAETIRKYQQRFKNIVYRRMDYRIGIYDAWNVGIEMARGEYLTNTNLDDLRHPASLQIQAETLDRLPFADVVYQDFYYTFDPTLDFDQVAAFGFKSDLPIVTPLNLLHFNSPHNAPMWRKALHSDVGMFNTAFKSAGDYEFWMRCLTAGKVFYKINTPHVVYYQNPQGVSTDPNMPGVREGHGLFKQYARKLQSPLVYGTSEQLAQQLEAIVGASGEKLPGVDHYDVVASALLRLARATRTDQERAA